MSVECRTSFKAAGGEQLTATRQLTEWVTRLPASATLSPITVEKGHQRDPWQVLVGLSATWTEEGP